MEMLKLIYYFCNILVIDIYKSHFIDHSSEK